MATPEELTDMMKQVEEKGIGWDTVEEKLKISRSLLNLYAVSGPVPVTVVNGLKKVLEESS